MNAENEESKSTPIINGISNIFWMVLAIPAFLVKIVGAYFCFVAHWIEILLKDLNTAIEKRNFVDYVVSIFLSIMAILIISFSGPALVLNVFRANS